VALQSDAAAERRVAAPRVFGLFVRRNEQSAATTPTTLSPTWHASPSRLSTGKYFFRFKLFLIKILESSIIIFSYICINIFKKIICFF
jgi:hypothetical protein